MCLKKVAVTIENVFEIPTEIREETRTVHLATKVFEMSTVPGPGDRISFKFEHRKGDEAIGTVSVGREIDLESDCIMVRCVVDAERLSEYDLSVNSKNGWRFKTKYEE